MSRQVVRTHPPKLLLVWWSSILIFLGPFLGVLTPSFWLGRRGPFIVSRASSLWRWEDSLTFAVMMALWGWQSHHYPVGDWQRVLGGWFIATLVFSLCRRCGQVVASRLKRLRNVLLSMLLAKWVMIAHEIRSRILFGMTTIGSGQRGGRATCPTEECLVRPGWPATCTLRGGPYNAPF